MLTNSYIVALSVIKHIDKNAPLHCRQPVNIRAEQNGRAKNMSASLCFSCLFDSFLFLFFPPSSPSACSPHHLLPIQADGLFVFCRWKHQLNKFTVTAFEPRMGCPCQVLTLSPSLSRSLLPLYLSLSPVLSIWLCLGEWFRFLRQHWSFKEMDHLRRLQWS